MQAIILKKIPIREYDELVICYAKDAGKQVYQAKGVLQPTSKQAGHLDILNLVDFSLVHKNSHPIITSACCLETFPRLKSLLPATAAAFFLLECFDKLIFEGEPDLKLWDFLLAKLHKLNQEPPLLTKPAYAGFVSNGFSTIHKSEIDWPLEVANMRLELLKILGYDPSMPIEHLANSQLKSLQFARDVIKYP